MDELVSNMEGMGCSELEKKNTIFNEHPAYQIPLYNQRKLEVDKRGFLTMIISNCYLKLEELPNRPSCVPETCIPHHAGGNGTFIFIFRYASMSTLHGFSLTSLASTSHLLHVAASSFDF